MVMIVSVGNRPKYIYLDIHQTRIFEISNVCPKYQVTTEIDTFVSRTSSQQYYSLFLRNITWRSQPRNTKSSVSVSRGFIVARSAQNERYLLSDADTVKCSLKKFNMEILSLLKSEPWK